MALRVVMMGTGSFALPTFRALLESRHVAGGLFTQPSRFGPGHHRHRNPLKELADEHGIPVFQPENVNVPDSIARLRTLETDLCLVAAYGQILSPELLRVPRLGAVNVHASILPKYRGAAPIQWALLNGDCETGVTIFQIEPRLDAGPILAVEKILIGTKETSGDLEERLAAIGARLAMRVLDQLDNGTAIPMKQDSTQASRAPRLRKEDGAIDWSKTPRQIDCHVRAMQPWPMADAILVTRGPESPSTERRTRLIVLEVAIAMSEPPGDDRSSPGTVVCADRRRLIVQTGGGPLEIVRLRPEGKRAMSAAEFLCGHPVEPGDRFESPR